MVTSVILPLAAVVPGLILLVYFNARQNYHLSGDIVWSAVLLGAASSMLAVALSLALAVPLEEAATPLGRAARGLGKGDD